MEEVVIKRIQYTTSMARGYHANPFNTLPTTHEQQ